jgi:hypothetical protein
MSYGSLFNYGYMYVYVLIQLNKPLLPCLNLTDDLNVLFFLVLHDLIQLGVEIIRIDLALLDLELHLTLFLL